MSRVCLTFDNGPEPGVTEGVLDALAARGLKATFFVIGRKLEDANRRRLAERTRAEGHRVGNHTYTHSVPLGRMEGAASQAEIDRTQDLLGDLAPERLFRPYGDGGVIGPHLLSGRARDRLAAARFTCVVWNAVPRDWADPQGWVDTALALCAAREHSLLVLHDLPTGAMRLLPTFLDRLAEIGADVTTDLPSDCLPIVAGKIMAGCGRFVTPGP
jgi:peptidoglycan/xylan/chitin deacetylase (PgdA/CDA1 family)